MTRNRSVLIGLLFLLAACNAAGTSQPPAVSPDASESDVPESSSPEPSPTSQPSQAVATTEPIPSDELGAFTCDLPITEPATAFGITNYTDIRVGTHDGYDRFVMEFNAGTPEVRLDRDEPPHEQDASGIPLDVEGEMVLKLVLPNGTAAMESGEISYNGPKDLDPGFPMLVDVVHGGDFEAQTTVYIGLASETCVRVTLLTDPDRVVIDFEH